MTDSKYFRFLVLLTFITISFNRVSGQSRRVLPLDTGWKFKLGDTKEAKDAGFDDSGWRDLDLPHDWSIEGQYDNNVPSGGSGGYLPTGIGWYRKHFILPESVRSGQVWIEFDGIYENSEVWINGQYLGKRPFGYISFHYDLTQYVSAGENVIAIRVDNSNQPNSRWYSGSGIYRHVRLVMTNNIHVAHWGVYVTTPEVSKDSATIAVQTEIENKNLISAEAIVRTVLIEPEGKEIAHTDTNVKIQSEHTTQVKQQIKIITPSLWSVETPVLYTLRTVVIQNRIPFDEFDTVFGIRKIEYDVDRGFLLNDKPVKMKGVCLHHAAGCVGAAVPQRVWERRLEILKQMGCNAIRTAHNQPAPEFLDLCDRMGFLVMDEAFDEWTIGKTANGYNKYFDEWSERDLTDFIRRDRNHPSVVMWSVGNEVREQPRQNGHEVLRKLVDIVHREDPTRPLTQGCDNIAADGGSTTLEFLELLDIVGYNYVDRWHERRELYYSIDRHGHPDWKFVGTESVSVGGIRGGCSLGNDTNFARPNYNSRMIRAEQLWKFVATHDYVIGDFMWTGIDYLGESHWPSKHASSGIIDTCGFPKDGYYFYKSRWTEEPMIHIFPHWNWRGREGQFIPVLAYTNCDNVELYLNDKLIGVKSFEFPRQGNSGSWFRYETRKINGTTADLHLSWDVPYEPGVLKAVGKIGRQIVCTEQIRTTGNANAIRLKSDRNTITTDHDIAHVRVEIVGSDGLTVPTADNLVHFSIEGQGKIIGVDNGNPQDMNSYKAEQRRAFNGLCLVILQSTDEKGTITLTADSEGLKGSMIKISVQP
jgi:beta-galactosidase